MSNYPSNFTSLPGEGRASHVVSAVETVLAYRDMLAGFRKTADRFVFSEDTDTIMQAVEDALDELLEMHTLNEVANV